MILCCNVYRYVDYAVTDILQMVGQANRPVLDTNGVCAVCVCVTYDHIYLCCPCCMYVCTYAILHLFSHLCLDVSKHKERVLQEISL